MNNSLIGFIAALAATAVWAGNFVAARALAEQIPPIQFNFWRWAIALLAILPFALPNLRKDLAIAREHLAYLSLMAILGVTLMNSFIYKAGQTTESLNMALIMPATPALILILARIVYKEPIKPKALLGLGLCLCGIIILISRGSWQRLAALQFQAGDLWALACMACFALYSLLMPKRPADISPIGFNALVFGLGLIYCLPLLAIETALLPLPKITWPLLIGIAYSGLGCSALAFWLWTIAVDRIGPVRSGFIYYSLPFFAALMSWLILGETVIAAQAFGGCLIICGIILATVKQP